ncbi:hypothetical protein Srufu_015650 [Streptomyces libani subsp. rufus]|nr:hypothetical protein Srufu_015650 [Streptomyces libani subsp. rufus]
MEYLDGNPAAQYGHGERGPQAHGKVGGVKAFSRRHVGHRTGTLSAMVGSWQVGRQTGRICCCPHGPSKAGCRGPNCGGECGVGENAGESRRTEGARRRARLAAA